jgi:cytochrome c oxidase cbb3-type subunit 4
MFREIITQIPGTDLFAIMFLLLFILVFGGILVWTIKADRTYLDYMKELPLNKDIKIGEADDVKRK